MPIAVDWDVKNQTNQSITIGLLKENSSTITKVLVKKAHQDDSNRDTPAYDNHI